MTRLSKIPYDALRVGVQARYERVCVVDHLHVFANVRGELNSLHLPKEHGDGDATPQTLAPSLYLSALIFAVLANPLLGPRTLYQSLTLKFLRWTCAGDNVVAKVRVLDKVLRSGVRFKIWVEWANCRLLVQGPAQVTALLVPKQKIGLGLQLNQTANQANGPDIGAGPVRVLVIPTNEERVIARATLAVVGLATRV
jgi:acyl dehydratase